MGRNITHMKYYEVHVAQTCKPMCAKSEYYKYNKDVTRFPDMQSVKKHIKETYGTCKREKMYRDGKDGEAIHVGYIYCYNTPKVSYDDQPKHNQDWLEIREIKATPII